MPKPVFYLPTFFLSVPLSCSISLERYDNYMDFQEEGIVEQLRDKKHRGQVFAKIVRAYQEPLYWYIRKMVLTHDDANDVLQNVLMKAWTGLDGFRGESKVSTWLYRIATNESLTFLDQQRLRATLSIDDEGSFLYQKMEADPYFDGNEVEKKLQRAILSLPHKQRLVFNMRYFDEMPYDEIEKILGTSVGALKASYHHAAKKIEAFLKTES